jgi:L-ascorbate metabolism protein UlaG (beta-lactamase superfamily)
MEVNGVKIEYLGHSGFVFTSAEGLRIAIDPYNISDKIEKVDFLLITHSHYDHCSIKDIEKLVKPGTIVVVPADAQSKITRFEDVEMQVIESGDELNFEDKLLKIQALPAYNINKEFHTKEDGWLGYLIKIDNVIIYHSGDTDKIPEMEKLSGYGKHGNNFVALLPVSGETVMDSDEAFDVAKMLNVDLALPMHYGAGVVGTLENAENFVKLCRNQGIASQILDKI